MLLKTVGKASLFVYRLIVYVRSKSFSVLISGSFYKFGKHSVIMPPLRISGEERIEVGTGIFIGPNSWLQTLQYEKNTMPTISIGDGTSIVGSCVISAMHRVILENDVLLARNVYISDHTHKYSDISTPVLAQGLEGVKPVLIRRGAWIGENVVICPGVTIGVGAVIGANSVVKKSVPDFCLAVGSPAQVIKNFGSDQGFLSGKDD
jgi:lipopolysaccharide O-acetyltransferase